MSTVRQWLQQKCDGAGWMIGSTAPNCGSSSNAALLSAGIRPERVPMPRLLKHQARRAIEAGPGPTQMKTVNQLPPYATSLATKNLPPLSSAHENARSDITGLVIIWRESCLARRLARGLGCAVLQAYAPSPAILAVTPKPAQPL